jgi:hypothetical protein
MKDEVGHGAENHREVSCMRATASSLNSMSPRPASPPVAHDRSCSGQPDTANGEAPPVVATPTGTTMTPQQRRWRQARCGRAGRGGTRRSGGRPMPTAQERDGASVARRSAPGRRAAMGAALGTSFTAAELEPVADDTVPVPDGARHAATLGRRGSAHSRRRCPLSLHPPS